MGRRQIEEIQESLIDEAVALYEKKKSLRAAAVSMKISMTKVRKMLITAGRFESDVSRAVGDAFAAGLSAEEIAGSLRMSLNNVYQYLPYQHVVYNMPVRSGEAVRQERYRARKKGALPPAEPAVAPEAIGEIREKTEERIRRRFGVLYVAVNERMRKVLPIGFCTEEKDPAEEAWELSGDPMELPDPPANIWCADVAVWREKPGRKSVKTALAENANCGYAVAFDFPPVTDRHMGREDLEAYREELRERMIRAIRERMIGDGYPEERVDAFLAGEVCFVKARHTRPSGHVAQLCDGFAADGREPDNAWDRKFGNSVLYRSVEQAAAMALGMDAREAMTFTERKYRKMLERMEAKKEVKTADS